MAIYTRVVVIDEAGNCHASILHFCDAFLKIVKGNELPFGGIQIILLGDVLQLPPFVKEKANPCNENQKNEDFEKLQPWARFFFQTKAFCKGGFEVYYLTSCYRQHDPYQIDLLNAVRIGEPSADHLKYLNSRCGRSLSAAAKQHVVEGLSEGAWSEYENDKVKLFRKCKNFYLNNGSRVKALSNPDFIKNYISWRYPAGESDVANVMLSSEDYNSYEICSEGSAFTSCLEKVEINALTKHALKHSSQKHRNIWIFNSIDNLEESDRAEDIAKFKMVAEIGLYVGLRIQFLSNTLNRWVSNNQFGFITRIECDSRSGCPEKVIIKAIMEGRLPREIEVELAQESAPVPHYDKRGKFEYTSHIYRKQFPFRPAVGSTLFNVIGTTVNEPFFFSSARMSDDKEGFFYTASSRPPDLEQGFFSVFPVVLEDIIANPIAKAFDNYHRRQGFRSKVDYEDDFFNGSRCGAPEHRDL